MSAFVEWLADAGKSAGSAAMTGASQGLVGSLFGRSGFQRKKDQMQLNEQMMQIQQQLALEAYQKQQELIKDQREYDEKQWNEKNSPEAIVRNLEKAGINAAQFLSGGSSSIQPFSGGSAAAAPMAHSSSGGGLSYQTPQFPGNPLALAQIEDLRASANLKNAQADNEPIRGELLEQQVELEQWKNAGMPYANEMLAINAEILRVTKGDKINLSSMEVKTAAANLDKLGRQIRDYDDKHDVSDIMKQQAINQCALQVASFAAKVAEAYLIRANTQVSNATVEVLKEQARKYAIDYLNGRLDFVQNIPKAAGALRTTPKGQALVQLSGGGIVGSVTGALAGVMAFFASPERGDSMGSDYYGKFLEEIFGEDFESSK